MTQIIKKLPAVRETQVLSLGRKIPWRKEWLSSPVFLSGAIPWTAEPCGLQSMRSQRVRHDWVANTFTFNTSQFFNFLISKRVCMFLRICQYFLYSFIYRHYWSCFVFTFNHHCFATAITVPLVSFSTISLPVMIFFRSVYHAILFPARKFSSPAIDENSPQ